MSRSCAKPTCSTVAVSWFDMERSSQVVRRSSTATEQGIALCQPHADRFGLPVGWSFVDAVARAVPEAQPAKANGSSNSGEVRDNAWFVSEPEESPVPTASTDEQESLANPTEGSLMHRAFHGPSSGEKGERAKGSKGNAQQKPKSQRKPKTQAKAQRKQKSQRKRKTKAASVPEAVADEMNELPFPPEGTKTAV